MAKKRLQKKRAITQKQEPEILKVETSKTEPVKSGDFQNGTRESGNFQSRTSQSRDFQDRTCESGNF